MRGIGACCIALALAGGAGASPIFIPAGNSNYQCGPCSADLSSTPIPAGFFGDMSDPFNGVIMLGGVPLDPQPTPIPPDFFLNGPAMGGVLNLNLQNTFPADTVVQRLGDISLPGIGDMDVIPIEIVQLNLVSIQPIIVTYNGGQNPQPWNVDVALPPTQPPGQMTVTRTHPNGGTFEAVLPVRPTFIFTPVDIEPHAFIGIQQSPFEFGDTLLYSGTFTVIPEPGTGALLIAGLLAGCLLRSRARKR